jgi:hypothetical protein
MSDTDPGDGGCSFDIGNLNDGATGDGGDITAPDQSVEVTSQTWLGRLLGSLLGSLIGILFVVTSVLLLTRNEHTEIMKMRSLDLAARLLV